MECVVNLSDRRACEVLSIGWFEFWVQSEFMCDLFKYKSSYRSRSGIVFNALAYQISG